MSIEVYIRPLEVRDALTSYQWRNDPEIWKFTGGRPDKEITAEIELEWISKIVKNADEKRFAICVKDSDQYIGNIQLTNIGRGQAQYHIFIGEKLYWGKGLAKQATYQILKYAFEQLNIETIFLEVNPQNSSACNLYKKIGFEVKDTLPATKDFIVMAIDKTGFAGE